MVSSAARFRPSPEFTTAELITDRLPAVEMG
jgi:hypothetical protein